MNTNSSNLKTNDDAIYKLIASIPNDNIRDTNFQERSFILKISKLLYTNNPKSKFLGYIPVFIYKKTTNEFLIILIEELLTILPHTTTQQHFSSTN